MSWQVQWTNAGEGRDLLQHKLFENTADALNFADEQIHSGGRVYKMNGPSGEVWDESQIRIAVTKKHIDQLDSRQSSA